MKRAFRKLASFIFWVAVIIVGLFVGNIFLGEASTSLDKQKIESTLERVANNFNNNQYTLILENFADDYNNYGQTKNDVIEIIKQERSNYTDQEFKFSISSFQFSKDKNVVKVTGNVTIRAKERRSGQFTTRNFFWTNALREKYVANKSVGYEICGVSWE